MSTATTTIISSSATGFPTPVGVLDHLDADNETRMIVGSNTLVVRRTPVNWAVICLIDKIQREHAAASSRVA